jgi:hypothetical protein
MTLDDYQRSQLTQLTSSGEFLEILIYVLRESGYQGFEDKLRSELSQLNYSKPRSLVTLILSATSMTGTLLADRLYSMADPLDSCDLSFLTDLLDQVVAYGAEAPTGYQLIAIGSASSFQIVAVGSSTSYQFPAVEG